jgi:hypothetical protein
MAYSKEEQQAYDRKRREDPEYRAKKVAQARDWRHRNAEHMREWWRANYQANRERILERRRNGNTRKPEYVTWVNIKQRCLNPNIRSYRWYGQKGITICDRWLESFANFYEDMGPRPSPKHSIERLDGTEGYEPSNCVWATKHVQSANQSNIVMIEFNGKKQHIAAWARETGLSERVIGERRKKGLPPEQILAIAA